MSLVVARSLVVLSNILLVAGVTCVTSVWLSSSKFPNLAGHLDIGVQVAYNQIMTAIAPKDSRLAVRMSALEKELIERAAAVNNQTVTEFVVSNALDSAKQVLQEQNIFLVSDEHFDWLMDFLDKPDEDNPGLQRLLNYPLKTRSWPKTLNELLS